jgi:TolB protein
VILKIAQRSRVTEGRQMRPTLLLRCAVLSSGLLPLAGLVSLPVRGAEEQNLLISSRRTGNAEIVLIRPDGTELKNLTNHPSGDTTPAWSPDGKRIVFESDRTGHRNLYMMDAGGGNVTQLTSGTGLDVAPSWSPDGKKIAFVSDRSGNREIWVMDANGDNPVNLTNDPASDAGPDWSPDGKQILFTSNRGDQGYQLYLMEANGANQRLLLSEQTGIPWAFPAWSPDGKRVAYSVPARDAIEIWVCNSDGTGKKKLTDLGGINTWPAWSPDGKQIAFVRYPASPQAHDGTLWIMDADGMAQNQVAAVGAFQAGRPAWRPRK